VEARERGLNAAQRLGHHDHPRTGSGAAPAAAEGAPGAPPRHPARRPVPSCCPGAAATSPAK
jgi:hypothetical protein